MTENELAEHLEISNHLLRVLYRYLKIDIDAISAGDGFCPPVLSANHIVSSRKNIRESAVELHRVADAAISIIELLGSTLAALENTTQTEKSENANE